MAKSEKGKVTIRLENVDWGKSLICPYSMTRTRIGKWICWKEKGLREGYALKSCEVKDKEATFKLKLYYPVNQ